MDADVIVVGVGTMGLSTCLHLARRGVRVLGIDQFGVPHNMGSYTGYARMIRQSYFEHPDYVPLLKRAYQLWDQLEKDSGQRIFQRTGAVYVSPPDGAVVAGCAEATTTHRLDGKRINLATLKESYPQFQYRETDEGFVEPIGGVLLVEPAMSAQLDLALRAGLRLRTHEPVLGWEQDGDSVRVRTLKGSYRADKLVITGGAWAERLVRSAGVTLTPTRQTQFWFWPEDPAAFELGTFPAWFYETTRGAGYYGFPLLPGQPGLKIAEHVPGAVVDPNTMDRTCRPEDLEKVLSAVGAFLPGALGDLIAMKTCLYTNSSDGHFIIDQHPESDRVSFAAGMSGHGFKFATVLGEVLVEMALDGRSKLPVDFLRLSRF